MSVKKHRKISKLYYILLFLLIAHVGFALFNITEILLLTSSYNSGDWKKSIDMANMTPPLGKISYTLSKLSNVVSNIIRILFAIWAYVVYKNSKSLFNNRYHQAGFKRAYIDTLIDSILPIRITKEIIERYKASPLLLEEKLLVMSWWLGLGVYISVRILVINLERSHSELLELFIWLLLSLNIVDIVVSICTFILMVLVNKYQHLSWNMPNAIITSDGISAE